MKHPLGVTSLDLLLYLNPLEETVVWLESPGYETR